MNVKKLYFILYTLYFIPITVSAQVELSYYFPNETFNAEIPTPEEVLGHQVGEWHVSHDKIVMYAYELARTSDRVEVEEFGRTHEGRRLLLLKITTPENHKNLENIRQEHVKLTDPAQSGSLNTAEMPIITYQGFSIHGNEASGANAGVLYAYYLAAAQGKAVEDMLSKTVVLLDPCYNPDGLNRFASWVNVHKNKHMTDDSNDREYNETWPRGRTNHYWFDLNRDWLPTVHPESQGRVKNFHHWKPNILTDHHEMGTNATFFFQPGIPSRTHPWTPQMNQDLTEKIGNYHAAALDKIGSLYYTKESFDDFYYGKGSTYPDVNGAVGILFEQASSRGHLQASINGQLTFPFTIKNQLTAARSTLQAAYEMRKEMLDYQRDFYTGAIKMAKADRVKAIAFGHETDGARVHHFIEMLQRHQVKIYKAGQNINAGGHNFKKETAYVIPLEQPQYRLLKAVFEKRTEFQDSLFYDVSAFNLAMAYNLPYGEVTSLSKNMLGDELPTSTMPDGNIVGQSEDTYAYLFEWDGYYAPRAAYQLMAHGLQLKVASEPFTIPTSEGIRSFDYGTVMVRTGNNQALDKATISKLINKVATENGITIYAVNTGLTGTGIDLGSRNFNPMKKPKVLLLIGGSVSSYDAGETWHLLDTRYHIPVTKVEASSLSRMDLHDYNVIIMSGGGYGDISNSGVDNLRDWLRSGGVLIASRSAVNWANSKKLAYVSTTGANHPKPDKRPYTKADEDGGAKVIGGAIFETELDLTHPLAYGFSQAKIPVFRRGTSFYKTSGNPYATPLRYTNSPLLSGYISAPNEKALRNTASVVVCGQGGGRVICMVDNMNFRGFWYGTNKIFMNAVFFGHTINYGTVETSSSMKKE